jgi:hypothetical protein
VAGFLAGAVLVLGAAAFCILHCALLVCLSAGAVMMEPR